MKAFGLVLALIFFSGLFAGDEMIVFMDSEDPKQLEYFTNDSIIETWKKKFPLVKFKDIQKEGAPESINFTPQIVVHNSKGTSYYLGKYTNLGRIKNFKRTASVVEQKDKSDFLRDVLTHSNGKSDLMLKFKLTSVQGDTNADFVNKEFKKEVIKFLGKSSKAFEYQAEFEFQSKLDRKVYVDIHPYINGDDLYLSYALFSQYNCIDPILDNFSSSAKFSLKKGAIPAYKELFKRIEKDLYVFLKEDRHGYGFKAIESNVSREKWSKYVMEYTAKKSTTARGQDLDISKDWRIVGQINPEVPLVSFHFLEPVDNYAGEVKLVQGSLSIDSMDTCSAVIEVPLASVTMGDDFLDGEVHNSKLKISNYPTAKVLIKNQYLNNKIEWGVRSSFEWDFELELKGITMKIPFVGFLEPILNDAGDIQLIMDAGFTLTNLYERFGIKGPDGPQDASNTMKFYVNVVMQ